MFPNECVQVEANAPEVFHKYIQFDLYESSFISFQKKLVCFECLNTHHVHAWLTFYIFIYKYFLHSFRTLFRIASVSLQNVAKNQSV